MSDEGIRIRRMDVGDVERVLELAAGLTHAPKWPESVYLTAIDAGKLPLRIALVAEAEELVGFAVAVAVGPEAEVETIGVASSAQRRGVGARLMKRLETELRAAGAEELHLEVREGNEAAISLYRNRGFREVGRRAGYYADPVEDALLLQLRLGIKNNSDPGM